MAVTVLASRSAVTSADSVAAGLSRLIGGARSVPLATVKAISVSPAAKVPSPAICGAKPAVLAASMSRPIASALAMMAAKASGLMPAMVSPFSAAVPDPDRAAIMASTDLPLVDSAAEISPLPLMPASGSTAERSLAASFN